MDISEKVRYPLHLLMDLNVRNRRRSKELESSICALLLEHFPEDYAHCKNELEEIIRDNADQNRILGEATERMWASLRSPSFLDYLFGHFGYVRKDAEIKSVLKELELEWVEATIGIPSILELKARLRPKTMDEEESTPAQNDK